MTDTQTHADPGAEFRTTLYRKALLILALVGPFAATFYAIFHLHLATAKDITVMAVMYVLCCLGITVGYHRLLTHRSFKTYEPIRFFFFVLGSMALQGPALFWAATHLKHHAHTDKEGDPHSPWTSEHGPERRSGVRGFLHAHMGWLFSSGVEPTDPAYLQRLKNDRTAVVASQTFVLWLLLGMAIPYFIGGWQTFLWGTLVRIFLVHHVTWSVNSVCHVMGRRPFETTDQSRNNLLVSWLAMGEGSHNTHHAYPASARQGLDWWELDVSYFIIWTLEKLGLAWDVKRIPRKSLRDRRVAKDSAAAQLMDGFPVEAATASASGHGVPGVAAVAAEEAA